MLEVLQHTRISLTKLKRTAKMETDVIIARLKNLGLHGMAESLRVSLLQPIQMRPSIETAVCKMIDTEIRLRDEKRTARLLKAAKLKMPAIIEDIKRSTSRNLTKDQLEAVSDCDFVRRGENIMITGQTGCGKTYLACALGNQACLLGLKVLFLSMNHFTDQIRQARLEGSWNLLLERLNKIDLLIFDDFGLQPMDADTRLGLLTILDDRYERKSVIITSQIPLDKWYEYLAEGTLADSIMDRVVNSSHIFSLTGDSLRSRSKRLTQK
jgi:DNA replication protein DnaC